MNASKSKAGWIDPAWRYVRLILVVWGIGQLIWLYFRMDRYSLFTSLIFLFLLIGCWAIKLQSRTEE